MSFGDSPERFHSSNSTRTYGRRSFLRFAGLGAAGLAAQRLAQAAEPPIQGFERSADSPVAAQGWQPVSDRKIRVGIIGYGVCQFGADFSFQTHPNVEVVAVSDLIPDRCEALAQGLPVQQDLSLARGTGQGRPDRGGFYRHRRAQPCAALHRSAETRQARGLRGAGRLRVTGGRGASV